jgi:hypothetical protein
MQVGDSVEVIHVDDDTDEYLGMVGVIVAISEDADFPYEVEFYTEDVMSFTADEIASVL